MRSLPVYSDQIGISVLIALFFRAFILIRLHVDVLIILWYALRGWIFDVTISLRRSFSTAWHSALHMHPRVMLLNNLHVISRASSSLKVSELACFRAVQASIRVEVRPGVRRLSALESARVRACRFFNQYLGI